MSSFFCSHDCECPICGREEVGVYVQSGSGYDDRYYCKCDGCDAMTMAYDDMDKACKAWDDSAERIAKKRTKRTKKDARDPQTEEVRDILGMLESQRRLLKDMEVSLRMAYEEIAILRTCLGDTESLKRSSVTDRILNVGAELEDIWEDMTAPETIAGMRQDICTLEERMGSIGSSPQGLFDDPRVDEVRVTYRRSIDHDGTM